jgi:hypothetical protein
MSKLFYSKKKKKSYEFQADSRPEKVRGLHHVYESKLFMVELQIQFWFCNYDRVLFVIGPQYNGVGKRDSSVSYK